MDKKYDIAISFAGEDRAVALGIASELTSEGVSVFYDEFEKADLWGKDLYEHLITIYKENSKYCLMLLSRSYEKKLWTSHERKAAQARAFKENSEYILPLKLDDTKVPGILETTGYIDYRSETNTSIAKLILKKLWGDLENDKGLNVLRIQFEKLYMKMMLLCDLSFMPSDHSNRHRQYLAPELHAVATEMFVKLKSDLQINVPIIDGLVLREITTVLEGIENILGRAEFLLLLNKPAYKNLYFISEIPESSFHEVYDFLNRLNIFEDYTKDHKRHFKPEEIISNWKKAEMETVRYCSDLGIFEPKDGLAPYIFDTATLRKLDGRKMKKGDSVTVFKR